MRIGYQDYDEAVYALWTARETAAQRQIASGRLDAGTRGTVTSGKHLDPIQAVIAAQFEPLLHYGAIIQHSTAIPVPGYFRKSRYWDVVVTLGDTLVAAIEAKSMSGSFGNNLNNRVEEAIGTAYDFWRADKEGFFGNVKPWIGWVYVLESLDGRGGSNHVVGDRGIPIAPTDPYFDNTTYMDRARLSALRLVEEGLYDAACIIASRRNEGILEEPIYEISTDNLTAAIDQRVSEISRLARQQGLATFP